MQKVLIGIVLAAILLTIPSIYERVQVEEANKTVETILPYKYIKDWIFKDPSLDHQQILADMKESGIDSISMEPDNLRTLQQKGQLTMISVPSMNQLLIFNQMEPLRHPFDKEGLFIVLHTDSTFEELTGDIFEDTRRITVEGVDYIFVPGFADDISNVPVGYDPEVVATVLDSGMELVPRIGDSKNPEATKRMLEELLDLKQPGVEKILFSGTAVPLSGEPEELKEYSSRLKEAGYSIFHIEFTDMAGFNTAAYTMDLNVVRLHSQALTEENTVDIVDKYVRGAKERNIRTFFVNANIEYYEEAQPAFAEMNNEIEAKLPSSFDRGSAVLFDSIPVPLWQIAMGLIGTIAFLALAAQTVFGNRKLTLAAVAGLSLLAILYLITDMTIILKAFALALAVTTPVFALLLKKDPESKYYLIASYFKAVGVTLVGIWLIVVLLNGNAFILGMDEFRGVKLVYVLPIAFIALYAIWGGIKKFLKSKVIYWHTVLLGVLAVVGIFYLGRSGNEGVAIPFELEARILLEQILYVRPRTKEFLIGLPIFVLALYIAKNYPKASLFLLIPASIGFLSMVNTFTHFHIPLSISLLRTGYSVIFGLLIGLILVFLYKWIGQRIITEAIRRWQE